MARLIFKKPGTLALMTVVLFLQTESINTKKIVQTKISRVISMQEQMEKSLRKTFENIFANYTTESAYYSKRLIYVCDKDCINSNLYGYGLSSAFLLAVLSERKFSIYPNKDTQFYAFYEKNVYEWKVNSTKIRGVGKKSIIPYSRNKHRFQSNLYMVERYLFKQHFDLYFKEEIVYLYGNKDWILDLRRHRRTAEKLPWLSKAHASDVIRLLHNGLFRSKAIENMINDELIKKVGENNLVCFHGNKKDNDKLHFFINLLLKRFSNDSKIYLSGFLNQQAPIMAYNSEIRQNLVEINNQSIYNSVVRNNMYNPKLIRQLIDIQVLKMCEILVIGVSPSGILAAQLRRKEDNIYCYRSGVIYPCTRRLIARSFPSQKPEYIDLNYFCQHYMDECELLR